MSEPFDLITLRVVVAVAECGSISAGSDRVHLALGAASARISALEATLGVRIFERSSRGVRATPTGHLLVQRGRELLADADRLALDLIDVGQGLQGSVRVMANTSALLEVLPQGLDAFARRFPLIRVEIEERSSPDIPLPVLEGRADLGIVDIAHPLQGLRLVDFFSDTLMLIAPRSHALASRREVKLTDFLHEELVCLTDGNAISSRMLSAAALLGHQLRIRMQMRSFDAVCRMVAGGLGVGVLPVEAIAPQLAHLPIVAVPLDETWAFRTHRLATRESEAPSAAAQSLIDTLLATPLR
ncbi:LysR substrate-binding domain-containing protein [Hydrogenophaga sp. RAC07]|uniref:LysR substrate-binding domain-containing protein n=1 Tax=Hydrogenophaga sp. RAC07 TaxID=1842537 RepID=UPI001560D0A8|nr:LysR substrate-binding domain-containing protein [Hydrogenophaga sp. RAC07]